MFLLRLLASCLCAASFFLSTAVPAEETGDARDTPPKFGMSNPEMLAAIGRARASLDDFLELVRHPEPDTSTFKLKILVRDGKAMETFWVKPFWILDEGFEGTIANTPEVVRNVSLGETVTFSRDDIVDWGYVRNKRQVGSFTVCVLFKYMRPADVEYFRRYNGFDC